MDLHLTGDDLLKGLVELIRTEGHQEDLYIRPLAFYSDQIIGVRVHDLTAEASIVVIPFGAYNKNEDNMHVTVSSCCVMAFLPRLPSRTMSWKESRGGQ